MEFKYIGAMNRFFNLNKIIDNSAKEALMGTNLTKMEAVYLRFIWENPGITQLELSKLNDTKKTIAVSYITKLENKKMILKKEVNKKNLIYCTKLGRETIVRVLKAQDVILAEMFKGYTSEEIEVYFDITQKITEGFSEPGIRSLLERGTKI